MVGNCLGMGCPQHRGPPSPQNGWLVARLDHHCIVRSFSKIIISHHSIQIDSVMVNSYVLWIGTLPGWPRPNKAIFNRGAQTGKSGMQFGFSTGRDLCRSEGGEKSAGQGQPQQASRRSGQNRRYQNTELQSKVEQVSNRTQQCSSICASSRTQIGANPRRQMHCAAKSGGLGF